MKPKTISPDGEKIQKRFFEAIDYLKQMKKLKTLHFFCNMYGLNRGKYNKLKIQLYKERPENSYRIIDLDVLTYLVVDFGISSRWLLTGRGTITGNTNETIPIKERLEMEGISIYNLSEINAINKRFSDEQTCEEYLKNLRNKIGITCKKCSTTDHYWDIKKKKFICKKCQNNTGLKEATVFKSDAIPLSVWFGVINVISANKKILAPIWISKILHYGKIDLIIKTLLTISKALNINNSLEVRTIELTGIEVNGESLFDTILTKLILYKNG